MFDELMKEATAIPFTSKMRFLTELQQPWGMMPPEPVLNVDTATGLFKIAAIIKAAQDDEQQAALDLEHQAMIDPQVQQALDYRQMKNERDEAAAQTREMNQQLFDAQSAQAMADQQAQTMGQQISELQGQIEQETAGRQDAQTQMIASKDQSLQEQMAVQDQKQQMNVAAQTFQEQANMLTQQLKGIAAQPTATPAALPGAPGMEGMPGVPGGEMPPPASAGAAQEQQEAMNAQQDAAIQGGQARQATEEDMIKQEQAAAMQGGPPPGMAAPQPGMEMPKQASFGKEARVDSTLSSSDTFTDRIRKSVQQRPIPLGGIPGFGPLMILTTPEHIQRARSGIAGKPAAKQGSAVGIEMNRRLEKSAQQPDFPEDAVLTHRRTGKLIGKEQYLRALAAERAQTGSKPVTGARYMDATAYGEPQLFLGSQTAAGRQPPYMGNLTRAQFLRRDEKDYPAGHVTPTGFYKTEEFPVTQHSVAIPWEQAVRQPSLQGYVTRPEVAEEVARQKEKQIPKQGSAAGIEKIKQAFYLLKPVTKTV